jgi:hypothetical protein
MTETMKTGRARRKGMLLGTRLTAQGSRQAQGRLQAGSRLEAAQPIRHSLKLSQPVMFVAGVTSAQKPRWVVNSPAAVLFQYPQQLN